MFLNKSLQRLLIVFIFISTASAAYIFMTPKNSNGPSSPEISTPVPIKDYPADQTKPATLESNKNGLTINNDKEAGDQSLPPTTTTPPDSPASSPLADDPVETFSSTFIIDNKQYATNVKSGSTAYDGMVKLLESKQISFVSKKFSGLGYFIEEINGIKNNPSTGFYWTLYINNEEAKVGVSTYLLKPGDIIIWKYENK